jgi:hypothetical protein
MTHTISRLGLALPGALLTAALLAPLAAHAQQEGPIGAPGQVVTHPMDTPAPAKGSRTVAQPPALPGARSANAPDKMDRPPSDMPPNEALFDAINRGDIVVARDALARGADLHATNVLGLTPTELSVDLGRNDITFLLLSLRGASSRGAPPAKVASTSAAPAHTAARPAPPAPAPRPAPVATVPRPVPQQYADVPATPVPQAGFLGFGGTAH